MTHLFALATVAFALIATTASGCHTDGKIRKHGEEWIVNNQFVVNCTIEASKSWHTTIVGCLSPQGQRVTVENKLTEGRTVVSCTTINDGTGSVRLHYGWKGGAPRLAAPAKETTATGNTSKGVNTNSRAS